MERVDITQDRPLRHEPPDLLDALGPAGRAALEAEAETIRLPAGETLFYKNGKPDALFLLLNGSLGVFSPGMGEEPQLLALVQPGETVGELGVISGQPRNATVTAIRDSKLLSISRPAFDRLMRSEPALMAGINRLLVYRLRRATSGGSVRLEPKTIAVLGMHDGIDVLDFSNELAGHLRALNRSVAVVGSEHEGQSSGWFNRLEHDTDHVLFCADKPDAEWLSLCARQADRIVLVGHGRDAPSPNPAVDLVRQRAHHQLADLILLQPDELNQPYGTENWLEALPVNRHFHLRRNSNEDWARITRVMCGSGFGLVLSGGGARAYAHIGVARALREAGISFDFTGGTSMGALIACQIAKGWTLEEVEDRVRACFVDTNPLSDYTLPVVSLVRGHKVKRLLLANLGNVHIGDLWLPFYCVSSNLTTAGVHVHRTGQLVEALRATMALPGILPPVITREGVLCDGAVIDNLPVDVMRAMHRGVIAAVDVTRDLALDPEWLANEIRLAPIWRLLRPPIIPILMRAATITGDDQTHRQASLADAVIEPPLVNIDIRDWKAFDAAIEAGYRHTAELLEANPDMFKHHRSTVVV